MEPDWQETKSQLARDFRIESAYVHVAKLSRVLGIAPSTIYTHIREGTFFLPYRRMHKTIAVRLDDLARWHCGKAENASADTAAPSREPAPNQSDGQSPHA